MWLGEASEPVVSVLLPADHGPAEQGPADHGPLRIGVAVSRGAVSFDRLVARTSAGEVKLEPVGADRVSVQVQAMRSLCHVLLNANEFVYVD